MNLTNAELLLIYKSLISFSEKTTETAMMIQLTSRFEKKILEDMNQIQKEKVNVWLKNEGDKLKKIEDRMIEDIEKENKQADP